MPRGFCTERVSECTSPIRAPFAAASSTSVPQVQAVSSSRSTASERRSARNPVPESVTSTRSRANRLSSRSEGRGMVVLAPRTRSNSSFAIGATSRSTSAGWCSPSASNVTTISAEASRKPRFSAAMYPLFVGCSITVAPALRAASAVASLDPSSTTRTLYPYSSTSSSTVRPMRPASLYAGTTTVKPVTRENSGQTDRKVLVS